MRRALFILFSVALLLGRAVAPAGQHAASWMRRPVFFSLEKEPTAKFLTDLSNRLGVPAQVSPKISGSLSGRFNLPDSSILFELLAKGHGIQWYHDGGRLFFYSGDEIVNASISLRTLSVDQVKESLVSLGAFDDRYEMRALVQDDQTVLYMNAPPRYAEVVTELVERIDVKQRGDKIMRLFRLNHAWARDQKVRMADGEQVIPGVATLLQQIVASELMNHGFNDQSAAREARGTVMPDLRLNAVIVWETKDRMGYFESLIRDLDQETELVEIRVAIVDVGTDYSKELGLGMGYQRSDGHLGIGLNQTKSAPSGELPASGSLGSFVNTVGSGGMAYTILGNGMNQFLVQINALETQGNAKVLSRPAILTMDNVRSTFERSETFYVRLEGTEEVKLEEITYGTTLQVTPHIISHPDGRRRIQMQIAVEDGAAADTGEVDNIPRTVNSRVETQAVVAEGQALVIGGHYSEVYRDTKTGIPVLSRIPGFGRLFQTKRRDTNTYERMFVISPRIISVADIPVVQDEEPLKEAFDSQSVEPVFRTPSVSDSRERIAERLRRENAELEQSRQNRVESGDLLPGEPVKHPGANPEAAPGPVPPESIGPPSDNGDGEKIARRLEPKWVRVEGVALPAELANELIRFN